MEQYRVLIVDDEPMQCGLIREVLNNAPDQFEILEAHNGSKALELLVHQKVDAVLLDKRMPISDGDSLCRDIRNKLGLALLPILMVTGTNAPNELARSFEAGATDFIPKPYRPAELLARLKSTMTTKRLTDQLNEAEWVIMCTHTIIGGHLCEGLNSMADVVPIIVYHHERWDGSGYPHGLVGQNIPLLARIFQIVDIYDALASVRPYKTKMTRQQIIAIFEAETARGWRDQKLVSEFMEILNNDEESLAAPSNRAQTTDEHIFNAIAATGAIDWDNAKRKHVM